MLLLPVCMELHWCPRCQRGHQSCYLLLAHPLNGLDGGHVAKSGSGNTSTSTSVRACVNAVFMYSMLGVGCEGVHVDILV